MNGPDYDDSDAAIAALVDPAERVERLQRIRTRDNTLTPAQSLLYTAAFGEMHNGGERPRGWLADRFRISPTRVSRILAKARRLAAEGVTA